MDSDGVRTRFSGVIRRAVSAALALAVAAGPGSAAPALATPVSRDFFAINGSKDSIYLEWALHPQAIRDGDKTFVVYQGPNLDPYAMALDNTSGAWTGPYLVGDNPLATDMHGAPALLIDKAGYIHVFFGGHHSPLRHARSKYPRDISSWTRLADVAPTFTYPQPIMHDDGTIDLFYRNGALKWVVQRSVNNGVTWSTPTTILSKDGTWGFYAHFSKGGAGEVFAAFVAIDWNLYFTGTSWARRDLHFMRRDASGVWRDDSGTVVTLPLTKVVADTKTRVFASGNANTNNPTVKVAPDGDPCILFTTGSAAGSTSYSHRFMRLDESTWSSTRVAYTDHFFDACALRFDAEGRPVAYTIERGTQARGKGDRDYTDDGGLLVARTSVDGGLTWPSEGEVISPSVPEAIYNNPHVIENAPADASLLLNEWTRGPSHFGLRLYLLGDEGQTWGRDFEPSVKRLAGSNRIGTALAVSREAFPLGSDAVVIASAANFPDALAGAPLAYSLGGPVLLSEAGGLGTANRNELKRLAAKRLIVLGGTKALSEQIVRDARALLPKATVERIAGRSRYDTAALIAARLKAVRGAPDAAIVAKGSDFPDAATACSWAAYRGRPILLAERDWMPPATAAAIGSLGISRTIVIGDETAIGPQVAARLPEVTRLSGTDRYSTSAAVASAALADGMLAERWVVAAGRTFPDSLTIAVLAARLRAPLVLTAPTALDPSVRAIVSDSSGTAIRAYVAGGTAAVSTAVANDAVSLMNGAD